MKTKTVRRSTSRGHQQYAAAQELNKQRSAAGQQAQRPLRAKRPLTALDLDPVRQALHDLQGMMKGAVVQPVQEFRIPPNDSPFVIYFPEEDLQAYGKILVAIHEQGWPLGDPLAGEAAPERAFVKPAQKVLRRQRAHVLRMLREATTGTGSLLARRASEVAKYSIWEQGRGGARCFVWTNGLLPPGCD